mmetsp:Transcript_109402/g.316245  ORF Transcript_109402/g.316245 Transcript_109402/m.316245 type:complete len:373 (-) Transcript_109402:66-1184(-)
MAGMGKAWSEGGRSKIPLWRRRTAGETPLVLPQIALPQGRPPGPALREARQVAAEFTDLRPLGQGSMSTVQAARRRCDGRDVVLKSTRSDDPVTLGSAQKEYMLLRQARHPSVIAALDFFISSSYLAVLVLEHFPGVELETAVKSAAGGVVGEESAGSVGLALLKVVSHLHRSQIVHRDIKPQNVLVSSDFRDLRLIDFNAASRSQDGLMSPAGSKLYSAPEVQRGGAPAEGADVWAVGVCLHYMLSGRLPRHVATPSSPTTRSSSDAKDQKREGAAARKTGIAFHGCCWATVSEACKDLLRKCLEFHEQRRPSARVLLQHRWLSMQEQMTEPPMNVAAEAVRRPGSASAGGTPRLIAKRRPASAAPLSSSH